MNIFICRIAILSRYNTLDFEEVYYFHGDVLGSLPCLNAHLDVYLKIAGNRSLIEASKCFQKEHVVEVLGQCSFAVPM